MKLTLMIISICTILIGHTSLLFAADPYVNFTKKGKYLFKEALYDSKYDHSKKDSPYLLLPYTLVQTAKTKNNTPIFFLRGGPGLSGTDVARKLKEGKSVPAIYKQLLKRHPIYFIDQRGTGLFEPSMWCDTSKVLKTKTLETKQDYITHVSSQVDYCLKKHKRFHIHGKFMDTLSVARDIETLRKHIKQEKIILFGESYGTHLALTYIREYQKHVLKTILVGVVGTDDILFLPDQYERTISKIDHLRLNARKPSLLSKIKAVLKRYDAGERPYDMARYEFLWLVMDNYYKNNGTHLMNILDDVNHGHLHEYQEDLSYKNGINLKYYYTVCASYSSPERMVAAQKQAQTALVGDALIMHFKICEKLGIKPLADKYREPLVSNVPTLAFSGDLDFKTPPCQAVALSEHFSRFIHVVDKKGAHNYCNKQKCNHILEHFLDTPPNDVVSDTIMIN